MHLYLVRHAEPKSEEEDPSRPLSKKGWTEIQKVAAFAATHLNIVVNRILHSGKLRAQQTAEVFSEHFHPEGGIKSVAGLNPLDNPSLWGKRLNRIKEDLMLVGHMPYLSKLTSYLLHHDENKTSVSFQTSQIVCLYRDSSGVWTVKWILKPDDV